MHDDGKQQSSLGNGRPEEEVYVVGMPGSLRMFARQLDQKGAQTNGYQSGGN